MTTNITHEHRRAFETLTSGRYENFALMSCFCGGKPTAAIATVVTVHPVRQDGDEDEHLITPLFVPVVPRNSTDRPRRTGAMTGMPLRRQRPARECRTRLSLLSLHGPIPGTGSLAVRHREPEPDRRRD